MNTPKVNVWKILAWLSLLAALWFVFTLILIAVRGGEWDTVITVNNPKKRMAAVALFFAGWVYLRGGAPFRDWLPNTGRLALLGISVGLGALAGEFGLRALLHRNQAGAGQMDRLSELGERKNINLQSFHALAAIVSLSPNRKLVYELLPGLDMEFGHRTLRTNRAGMRESRDYELAKPRDTVRIVGLGDSGMFGWGVHQEEDYLAVLEARLAEAGGPLRYEVLNLAVPGYNTQQEVEMLRYRGLAYDPDIVVVGWCNNDFGPPFFMVQTVDYRRRDVSFLYHLLFNRAVYQRLVEPPALRSTEIKSELIDPAIAEYTGEEGVARAFAELLELQREHGFRLLVFGVMNGPALRMFERLGIAHFNVRSEIPRDKYPSDFQVHFMHPRAEGHRVLGEELHALLERQGWLRP